ncbi:MATE family efflux transporter [Candidatus Synchoanobacter obligatus]|uniref:Polysaccharide biosynthesis C-terminal domain-containing protein n=1 Tax=Candidatus Synchoanobacter obligatus TaxID=2919597 RepID=A0ABT1L560_9GAMM|nr:MATE family efflux transporter [Candidatus Synchoanobacter obligatus]MCP8351998.1 polysaccharide biosynthesis C-terminal domain-containing protein [Candidatus Synchoanobacter obligatus]
MSSPAPTVSSLLRAALPLILAGLSSNLSIFVDRSILSHHDVNMMSHVTAAMNYCWTFLFATTGITWISKVFIGQYNGAKQYQKVTNMTWQMMIFSLSTLILFIPVAYLGAWIIPYMAHEHGLIYFQVLMLGGCLWPMCSALSSFFIGTYQTKTVLISLIFSNLINVALDLYWIPSMGTYGAALATITSMVFQLIFLLGFFLNARNAKKYHTFNVQYHPKMMLQAIKLGLPESLSHSCEMLAWATVLNIISTKGADYMVVTTLAQNLFILFMFVYSELGNAVKAMAANYIGENLNALLPQLLRSAFIIHTSFMLCIGASLYFIPSWFMQLFALNEQTQSLQMVIITSLKGVMLFMFLDGLAYIFASFLAAFGDTVASMLITASNMWLFLVLPTYLLIHYYPTTAATHSLVVLPFYGVLTVICYGLRHQVAKKQDVSVIGATSL